jgi:hypothetical protein
VAAEGLKWRVNNAVRASRLMPAPARLIMLTLSDRADAKTSEIPETHTPSLAELAQETDLGESTVKRHLGALEKYGWVARTRPSAGERARHKSTGYRLALGSEGATGPEGPEWAIEKSDSRAQSGPSKRKPRAQSGPTEGPERAPARAQSGPSYIEANDLNDPDDQTHTREPEPDGALFPVDAPPAAAKNDKAAADESFTRFWKAYPKKVAPDAARRAWDKAIKKEGAEVIIAAAEFYALECRTKEPRYIKHPQGWLNDGRWKDAPDPSYTPPSGAGGFAAARTNGHTPWRNPDDPSDYYGEI